MAKATLPAEEQTEAPAGGPVCLDDIERVGAERFGCQLAKVILVHTDGRRVAIDLPTAGQTDLSDLAERMLEKLKAVGDWVNGAALALLLDPDGDLEHQSGGFKRAAQELKKAGLISSNKSLGYRAK